MIIRDHHKPFLQIMMHHIASRNKDYILCTFPADKNENTKYENMKAQIYNANRGKMVIWQQNPNDTIKKKFDILLRN